MGRRHIAMMILGVSCLVSGLGCRAPGEASQPAPVAEAGRGETQPSPPQTPAEASPAKAREAILGGQRLAFRDPSEPREVKVFLFDKLGKVSPYPCACLRMIASEPVHVYDDPDETKFGAEEVEAIQLLRGPDKVKQGEFQAEGVYTYLRLWVWRKASGNMIFAPGFNAESALTAGGFDDGYREIMELAENADLDKEYAEATWSEPRSTGPISESDERPAKIYLVPLYADPSGGQTRRILVDHSTLVWLLGLDQVWSDLRRLHKQAESREAVILVCKTVALMAQAHREKWPSWKWDDKQAAVVQWCQSVAAGQ